jgi:high affinity sulfate transporter 1
MSDRGTTRSEAAYAEGSPFRPAEQEPLLNRAIPVSGELGRYRAPTARRDTLAGVTVAALAVPSAMAYGELAGVSLLAGLCALLLPTVAYLLLGSSRQVIIGPEGSISALVAVSILPLAAAGSEEAGELAAALALLVGVLFVAAFLLRLSWMADYFSRPVLIGYIHGVAVVLVISQLGKVLGLDIDERNPLPQLWEEIRELGDIQWTTFAVGAISIAVLLLARLVMPRFPAALLVVVGAIAASWAFDLEDRGVRVVGALEGGLPPLDIPTPGLVDTIQLLPAALGIFLVSFADEILTARSFAGRHNQHIRARQELLAMGAANMASGITQGISVSASGSRTAVNDSMSARTQVAGAIAAGVVLAILLFLTDPIEYLPLAVLGAVIISAAIGLVDPDAWRALWNTDRVELTIAAVTTTGVIVYGVLEALALAVGLSIIDVVRRSANPHDAVLGWVEKLGRYGDASVHASARLTHGVVVYRLDDRLFFANASYVKGRIREAVRGSPPPVNCVVFDMAVTHVDATGLEALRDIARDLRKEDIVLAIARAKSPLKKRLDEASLTAEIGGERFHPTVRAAVDAAADGRESEARDVGDRREWPR